MARMAGYRFGGKLYKKSVEMSKNETKYYVHSYFDKECTQEKECSVSFNPKMAEALKKVMEADGYFVQILTK